MINLTKAGTSNKITIIKTENINTYKDIYRAYWAGRDAVSEDAGFGYTYTNIVLNTSVECARWMKGEGGYWVHRHSFPNVCTYYSIIVNLFPTAEFIHPILKKKMNFIMLFEFANFSVEYVSIVA